MKSVKQLLDNKGHECYSIGPDAFVFDAIKLMAEKEIGALLVMEGDKLAGIISERDYARKVILKGRSSRETPIKDIMTVQVTCAGPEQSIQECMALMTDKRVRHLPIIENNAVIGMISIGDLVKAIIAEQQFTIEQLEQYISG